MRTAERYNRQGTGRMTPEERLDRIETIIEKLNQEIEKQNARIRELIVVSRTVRTSIQGLDGSIQGLHGSIQELHGSIQELREVQRKDHEEWSAQMKDLRDAQAATDEKLNILIDTVD